MKDFLTKLKNSLDTKNEGFSGRKLSALWANVIAGVLVIGYLLIGFEKDNFKSFPLVLGLTYTYSALCLGLVTAGHIIKFRNGSKTDMQEDGN
jgi:hypothetical protein